MKKMVALALLCISFTAMAKENILNDEFKTYFTSDLVYQSLHESIEVDVANESKARLHALIDLSRTSAEALNTLNSQVQEAIKANRQKEFWIQFLQGIKVADTVLKDYFPFFSSVCKSIKSKKITNADSFIANAQIAGLQARTPFCFIEGYYKNIGKLETEFVGLKSTLTTIKEKMAKINTDEIVQEIIEKFTSSSKDVVLSTLTSAQIELEKSFLPEPLSLADLQAKANKLATYIDCKNLRSKLGEAFTCTPVITPPMQKLNPVKTYNVVYDVEEMAPYVSGLDVSSLMRASIVYKTEIKPHDSISDMYIRNVKKAVNVVDDKTIMQQIKIISAIQNQLDSELKSNKIGQSLIQNFLISNEIKEKLIADLTAFKMIIEDYGHYAGTSLDETLKSKLVKQYGEILNLYGEINLSLNLPNQNIEVEIGDEKDHISLMVSMTKIGATYLLGKNAEEFNQIKSALKLADF
ncbi:MAG: hypothetical protein ACOYL6_18040 [Bacteriovoracaceae bacterium]